MQGLIIRCVAGVYDVKTAEGVFSCYAAGKFRSRDLSPMVGDLAEILRPERNTEKPLITAILPRRNELLRPPVANVDTLLLTVAVCRPNPDLLLTDQLVALTRRRGIRPLVCVNKADLDPAGAESLANQYRLSELTAVTVSARTGEGIEELKQALGPGLVCFCGQSAAGKSSLTNALLGKDACETGGLSKKTERGKHTTRRCELIEYAPGAFLADTPGFSLLEPPAIDPEEFRALYPEFEPYSSDCRFLGCNHVNEPDCAVKDAVAQGKLSRERYERYCQLFLENTEKWRKRYD